MQNESQYSVGEMHTEDIIISSRDIDSNYEPSIEEVKQYGAFLGIDPVNDKNFLYIAKKGLKAPIPAPWKACQTKEGQIYYFNFQTGESQWEHPCDEEYRKEFRLAKASLLQDKSNIISVIEGNVLDRETLSHRANPLDISDISALLTNPSERNQKIGSDDSIISAFNYSHRSNPQRQPNLEEQASQEGIGKNQTNQPKSKQSDNDVRNKELQKMEAEFETKLKNVEKELSERYEQTVLEQKRILEEKLESVLEQEEIQRISDEVNSQSAIKKEEEEEELAKMNKQEIDEIEKHETLLLTEKLNNLQYNHALSLQTEKDKVNSEIIEVERAKAIVQTRGKLLSSEDQRKELLAEYDKSFGKIEVDQQMKFENEINQLKLKLSSAYAERQSKTHEETNYDKINIVQIQNLEREYQEKLIQEKHRLYLMYQETRKSVQSGYDHQFPVPENNFGEKIKALEEERIQYFRQFRGNMEAINNQLQRNYEVQKLSFENSSAEFINSLKKEIKTQDKDLRAKENFFSMLNKLHDEGKIMQRELIEKENQTYEMMMGVKELEMTLKEYIQQIKQYQAKIENSPFSVNNRSQLTQKIKETHAQLERIGKEIKENEKEKVMKQALTMKSSDNVARQSLDKLLRKVEGIKNVITTKQERRRSATPGRYTSTCGNSLEKRAYFQDHDVEEEAEESSPTQIVRGRSGEILLSAQDKAKRWRSSDKRQAERVSRMPYYNDFSIDVSKDLQREKTSWYTTLETGEDKPTKHNRSDIWSGIEAERFSQDISKEDKLYPKKDKRYAGLENILQERKITSYSSKDKLYTSFERYKTNTTDGENMVPPKKEREREKSTSGSQSILNKQSDWMSTNCPILALRDQNTRKSSTYKTQTNLYGRQSLQNTSEIIYPKEFAYSIKNSQNTRPSIKSFGTKEPSRYLNLKHKIRDEKHFSQYDSLIKKYSSGH